MIYVYAPTASEGCLNLIKSLDAIRLRKFDGMQFLQKGRPVTFISDDTVICWGVHVPKLRDATVLNSSLAYPNQFEINSRMYRIENIGPVLRLIQYTSQTHYTNDMSNKARGLLKNESGMVPSTEFVGYGMPYTAVRTEYSLHVFKDSVIHGTQTTRVLGQPSVSNVSKAPAKVVTAALNAVKVIGLDFAKVTVATLDNNLIAIRKILTAPSLDAPELVDAYTKSFKSLLATKQQIEQEIKNIE